MQPYLKVTLKFEQNDINTFMPSSESGQNVGGGSTSPGYKGHEIGEQTDIKVPTSHGQQEGNLERPSASNPCGEEKVNNSENDDQDSKNAQNKLVVYDPAAASAEVDVFPDPEPINCLPPTPPRHSLQNQASDDIEVFPHPKPISYLSPPQNQGSRLLPSVGAFTVQCANCFKWRLIPSKEKYEEIREHILEHPFICEAAREWRPEISCNDDPDIRQDGSRLWAIDKPNIAQAPPGWERLLRIRGMGGTKFADVYYVTPSGKRLRSMVEVQRYLLEHPYEAEGVTLSQFSFQIPRPLQENYVQKRSARAPSPDRITAGMQGDSEPTEVSPLAWLRPEANTDLQLGMLEYNAQYNPYVIEPINKPTKRSKQPSGYTYNGGYMYPNHQGE